MSHVTTLAGIRCVGIVSLVANKAIGGNGCMCASKRVNVVMIKCRGTPSCCRMTCFACSRELCCYMIWIGRLVVIRLMTSNACIGCIHIVALVTNKAIVCNGCMCACKRVYIVMVKCRRTPCRRRMTCFTGSRELGCYMIWIGGLVVIRLMTSDACIGCIDITALMAGKAVSGYVCMCACQWVNIIMIKNRGTPCVLRMACFTCRRELGCDVVGVG
jgi:hypothetical protein